MGRTHVKSSPTLCGEENATRTGQPLRLVSVQLCHFVDSLPCLVSCVNAAALMMAMLCTFYVIMHRNCSVIIRMCFVLYSPPTTPVKVFPLLTTSKTNNAQSSQHSIPCTCFCRGGFCHATAAIQTKLSKSLFVETI